MMTNPPQIRVMLSVLIGRQSCRVQEFPDSGRRGTLAVRAERAL
ncbi:MAG: hypothetical protein ACPGWR_22635 [Ardenticatenaceae bacterium]